MKTKRVLSLFISAVICLSAFPTVLAEELTKENTAASVLVEDGIDYSDKTNWAYWNEGDEKAADLFFVCPTVDMGKDGNFNSDAKSEKYRESFVGAINMELGIYNEAAVVYAPYYRQATFPVYSLGDEEMEKYLSIAYEDVKKAFVYYAENTSASKPLILAGFSQGADFIIRLMKDLFDEEKYQRRLVAAYAIGWKLTEAEIKEYPHLKPAADETDTGVIVAFNSEDEAITASLIVGEAEKTYSINPLNWKTTPEIADKSLNAGACFTDYSGNIKEEIPNLTGAYIDEKRGTLKVCDIKPEDYPGKLFEDGIYHLYDYQFFFRNLQENVNKRLSAYNEKYAERLNVFYNDEIMTFDVEPVIENGRTLVPFRAIFEAMDCEVNYSEENGKQIVSANRGDDNLLITIGEGNMYLNNREIALDVPAQIKDGRTLVPLRAISESLDCTVKWHEKERSIYIYSSSEYSDDEQKPSEASKDNINPLPETLDIKKLENCTVSATLEKGAVYADESGKTVMDIKVYTYDLYDMADIASVKVNDVIVRLGKEIKITEVEKLDSGLLRINGGEENGGFDLMSDDSNVYYEIGMNDVKAYYELGEVTLPVSDDFKYIDESDIDSKAESYTLKDFLADNSEIEYSFSPNDTSIVIEDGVITKISKVYMP